MKAALRLALTLSVIASISSRVFAAVISTGAVTAVVKETGTLTILSEQTQRPISYTGMDKAVVIFGSGKPATLADVTVGQIVTVEYAMQDKKPVVARLLLPDPKPAATAPNNALLTPAERRGLDSTAAKDGDPTTQPGSKAKTDNDITTKPGKKDPADPDPTKKTDK